MSDGKIRIFVQYYNRVASAKCMDTKLNDELCIQSWGEELYTLVESKKCDKLVVNFENVNLMSSSALRVLITLNNKAKTNNVKLVLCCINDNIMEAFRITRLDSLFMIKKTEMEAIGRIS